MKKKIKVLITLLILILLFLILKTTYSKYVSEATGNVKPTFGKWKISVNGADITIPSADNLKDPMPFEIKGKNFEWKDGDPINTKGGKVAPGMKGTATIKIDPETDTSFEYEMELDTTSLKDTNLIIKDIKINGESKKDGSEKAEGVYVFKNTKRLSEIQNEDGSFKDERIDIITIEVEWPDEEDNDDEKDTKLGKEAYRDSDISFKVKLKALQYMGE